MKLMLFSICGSIFLQSFVLGRLQQNNDEQLMGVSQKKLENYMIKAIEGFRKMMPEGDFELDYPVMDPYEIEDVFWSYIDKSPIKKYNVKFFNSNTTIIKGLSNFEINYVAVSAKDMRLFFVLTFKNVNSEFPYELNGHMYKNFLPIYGKGIVKLVAPSQQVTIEIKLALEQSYIVVERASVFREYNDIKIQATGVMDLSESFANHVLDNILDRIVKQHGYSKLSKFLRNTVEEAVGGMTMDEFFDYLDYFVKKNDEN